MFGIDGIIITLIVAAVALSAISWMLGRAEQRRYEEVMRTGEREAAAGMMSAAGDRAVALPRSSELGSGYVSPVSRTARVAPAESASAGTPPRT